MRIPNATDYAAATLTDRMIVNPWKRFRRGAASGGIVLCVAAIVALVWANSPLHGLYHFLFHEMQLGFSVGSAEVSHTLAYWVTDALMAVFFLLVGMEIKRDALFGDLRDPKRAALPIAAAVGGMLVPALIYVTINWSAIAAGVTTGSMRGWGIPTATDIAFALGILALAGRRVPNSLRVFLCSFAVVDDLGALLIIAMFYTDQLRLDMLGWSGAVFALMFIAARMQIREPRVYALAGIVLLATLALSGVHPTIAGVLVATQIPASARVDARSFIRSTRAALDYFERHAKALTSGREHPALANLTTAQVAAARSVAASARHIRPPMQRIEQQLQPWVNFVILPMFALANAGVVLSSEAVAALTAPTTMGVVLGLAVGKPLGITVACLLMLRLGVAALPRGVSQRQLVGVATLGGIGFTMAIFINNLAFLPAMPAAADAATLGILAASGISAVVGLSILLAPGRVSAAPMPSRRDRTIGTAGRDTQAEPINGAEDVAAAFAESGLRPPETHDESAATEQLDADSNDRSG